MTVSAYYSAVIYISTQIAKMPFHIKDARKRVINDRISKLIGLAPNDEMNAFVFKLLMNQHAIHNGNAYAEIVRDNQNRIVSLYPIPTRYVQPMRIEDDLFYQIANPVNNAKIFLRPKEIFHLKNFHTHDGIVGLGLVSYMSEILGINLGANQYSNTLFDNYGMPSGVLQHPGSLSPEAREHLTESWRAFQSGRKAGSTAILEENMKYEPISHDPESMQFLETRKFSVYEIARFLRLPPTKLFDAEAATYNNVENANLEVITDCLDPWATNWEMEVNVKLLNNSFGERKSEMDFFALSRGDSETRSNYYKSMFETGAMTSNQIRENEGKPGYGENGDKYFVATNNFTPVERIDDVIDSQIGETAEDELIREAARSLKK